MSPPALAPGQSTAQCQELATGKEHQQRPHKGTLTLSALVSTGRKRTPYSSSISRTSWSYSDTPRLIKTKHACQSVAQGGPRHTRAWLRLTESQRGTGRGVGLQAVAAAGRWPSCSPTCGALPWRSLHTQTRGSRRGTGVVWHP